MEEREELGYIKEARELLREYLNTSYTLVPNASLDYGLVIERCVWTPTRWWVEFSNTLDEFLYKISYNVGVIEIDGRRCHESERSPGPVRKRSPEDHR